VAPTVRDRSTSTAFPESDVDLFTDDALADPYPHYDALREAGPAVWMSRLGVYAVPRYAEARAVLRDPENFSSARGVMLNDAMNDATGGLALICCDAPRHDEMRRVLRRPLMMDALRDLTPALASEAESLVERLVRRGTFNAVSDLAQHLPLTIISRLVGIPETGRERMLAWAAAAFDSMGPMNERTRAALPLSIEMFEYGNGEAVPPHLAAGGWAQMVYDAAARGELDPALCPSMMSGYLAPSLDTTINGISSAMMLLGEHPDQYDLLREDRSLIPNAVNEILRIESPIQRFTRSAATDTTIGEVPVAEGSRVMILFGAANRDARRWQDPERFDVRRERVAEHLAFGNGPHACVGSGLARLEMRLILEALVSRVRCFEVARPQRAINHLLRGLGSLEVTVTA
jgi:cytochrome P450